MKKIYLLLTAVLGMAVGVQAQRHCDVELVHVFGPQNNQTINCTDSFLSGYIFVNNGPDAILSTDSFWIRDANLPEGYLYKVQATGTALNGVDANGDPVPSIDVPAGDTILVYKWTDAAIRLLTLVSPDSPYNYVYTDEGVMFPNGNYFYPIEFVTFNDTTAVTDTAVSNNVAYPAITIDCPTGIGDIFKGKASQALNVYPNPTSSVLNFQYAANKVQNASVRVADITGRTLFVKELGKAQSGNNKYSIDVSALHTGTYIIELLAGDDRLLSKFTVQK